MPHIVKSLLLIVSVLALSLLLNWDALLLSADKNDANKPAPNLSSLDAELLDDLDNDLLKDVDDKPAATKPTSFTNTRSADDELLRDLGGDESGEDLGQPSKPRDPLVTIGEKMRTVEVRLSGNELDQQTEDLQKQILDDLSSLVQECKKQCQGGNCNKPGSPKKTGAKPGQSASKQGLRDSPSQTSSTKLEKRNTEHGDRAAVEKAMRESWGHLPQRARQQIESNPGDAFLPKYELMLEKYFKRLGEEDAADR